jgi:hypothetical protein
MRAVALRCAITLLTAAVAISSAGAQNTTRPPSDTGATASLTGTVYDSVAHAPLGAATVQIVDDADRTREYTVRADSLGRFRIDAMRPGQYVAGFFHPSLGALGIEPPLQAVTVRAGSDNTVQLFIPGSARIVAAICGPAADTAAGAMAGVVRDAVSGLPVANAKVVVTWREIVIDRHGLSAGHRRVPAQTDDDGAYHACNLPGADTVLVSAEATGRKSGVIEVPIPVGGLLRRDFTLGDSSSAFAVVPESAASAAVRQRITVLHGNSLLTGTARMPDGSPASGAQILVWGSGLETKTRSDGHFTLDGLPAGTFSVEARMLGFEPRRRAVDLSPQAAASVSFEFGPRVQQLSRVVVVGKETRHSIYLEEFLKRKNTGLGHYVTASDNALKNAFELTDAVRMTPGVRVVPNGTFGHVILMRGGCVPAVYVDGIPFTDPSQTLDDTPPEWVAGIEIYSGMGVPVQYQSNGCGVVLVWTKH